MSSLAALRSAAAVCAQHVPDGYGIAYGSHAANAARPASDLDLLYVTQTPMPDPLLRQLVAEVIALHRRHRLDLDVEVAHEVKLHATDARVRSATRLAGFHIDAAGALQIPALQIDSTFLNSEAFACRLVLNALTTPRVFLGGNLIMYRRHCRLAEAAVGLLIAAGLAHTDPFTVEDAAQHLTCGPDGAIGKDHLGYWDGPHLRDLLHRCLATQLRAGTLAELGSDRYTHRHQARRARIAALARHDHTARPDRILTAANPHINSEEAP